MPTGAQGHIRDDAVPSLLHLCVRAVAHYLHDGRPYDLSLLPQLELGARIFDEYCRLTAQARQPCVAPGRLPHLRVFAPLWQPTRLQLTAQHGQQPDAVLRLTGSSLQHLELSSPYPDVLGWAHDVRQLRCLSLRGCTALQPAALSPVSLLTRLRALDLYGLAQLDDACAHHLARLPSLEALHCGGTGFGDGLVEALTYGCRLARWRAEAGDSVHSVRGGSGGEALRRQQADAAAVQDAWPRLPLARLHLFGTRVSAEGLQQLTALAGLAFLDVRYTGVRGWSLRPLELRFGLRPVQGAVLSASNAAALAALQHNSVACCCERKHGSDDWAEAWAREGVQHLLESSAPPQVHCPPAGGWGQPHRPWHSHLYQPRPPW